MKRNLYTVALSQSQTTYLNVVASSKAEAKRKMKKFLEDGIVTPDSNDEIFFDKHATISDIEWVEENTEEEDWLKEKEDDNG